MKSMKRLSAGLLMLALLLTPFAFPAAADNTYAVTLPAGATGPATVAEGEDYTFTLAENALIVAYAEFSDGSICAAEATAIINDSNTVSGYTRKIPADFITGDFEIKTFTVETDGTGAFFAGGDGSAEYPFQIATELQLLQFMASCTACSSIDLTLPTLPSAYVSSDMHYVLTSDIVFHTPISMRLAPIAEEEGSVYYNHYHFARSLIASNSFTDSGFYATFDGASHCISGLRFGYTVADYVLALIPMNNGVIKNLTLRANDAQIATSYNISGVDFQANVNLVDFSALTAVNNGSIESCSVELNANCSIDGSTGYSGTSQNTYFGLLCAENFGVIDHCTANGVISIYQTYGNGAKGVKAGMICGTNQSGEITNCIAKGTLTLENNQGQENFLGGIVGYCVNETGSTEVTIVSKCENQADLCGHGATYCYVGGIVGYSVSNNADSIIEECINRGNITQHNLKKVNMGGIVSKVVHTNSGSSVIRACCNVGSVVHGITATSRVDKSAGGITGVLAGANITGCFTYDESNLALPAVFQISQYEGGTISYTYALSGSTDLDADVTSEEKELDADGFKATSLVTDLNDALGATDDPIFVAGDAYPIFAWLAESTPAADLTAAVTNSTGATPAASVNSAVVENGTAKLNVSGSKACVVIAFDGTNYTRMTAALNADGTSYDFTVPYAEGMTFTVAVKGDLDGDGVANLDDMAVIASANLSPDHPFYAPLSDLELCLGDQDGDGIANLDDMAIIASANLSPDHPFYEAIEW